MDAASSDMPVIALLGGVGSGKSTVAGILEQLGCRRIDADAIAHDVLNEPDVQEELRRRWGGEIFTPDGKVDRGALGEIVFSDSDQLATLNSIVHPLVRARMAQIISEARVSGGVIGVVMDAAVLLEAGCDDLCTHMVFVESSAADRARRVLQQRGWDESIWRAREKSQKSLDMKVQMCDYNVVNSSSVSRLAEQTRELLHRIVDVQG